jgi:hypothetical protein
MTQAIIDHLVIGAAELEKATKQVQDFTGAKFLKGGKHPLMATHNRLVKLQKFLYMEIIAADPAASISKGHKRGKRWFSLDAQATRHRLSHAPQPLCWVVAVNDIEKAAVQCGYNPGNVIEMTRNDLKWKITVPENGVLPERGVLPVLIEWPNGSNPAKAMPESNISLEELKLFHPHPSKIRKTLSKLNIDGPIEVHTGEPRIEFCLRASDNMTLVLRENCLANF